MMLARSLIPFPALALASTVACATGCGLEAAYAAFTTSTTGEASTGERPDSSGSTSTPGGSSSTADGSDGGSGTTSAVSSTSTASTTTSGDDTGEPVCGDGVVASSEECDGGEGCFECARDRWIFVTADSTHDGKFQDGIAGADSLCRQYALQSGRADATWKTYIAWISDTDHPMRDRLPAGIRGRYVRTDGAVVVDRAEDLFSGMLLAPINVDEHGQTVAGESVITGTMPDGTAAPGTHCDNWTSDSLLNMSVYLGDPSATDGEWTMENLDNPHPCTSHWRLYCLEGA